MKRFLKIIIPLFILVIGVFILWTPFINLFHWYQEESILREHLNGKLLRFHLKSRDLRRTTTVFVYLPPGYYKSARRYPTLYLLHGQPGSARDWFVKGRAHETADDMITKKRINPLIIVSSDGFGIAGPQDRTEYLNSVHKTVMVEDYVSHELPNYIDSHFRTIRLPGSRALGGLSSGGYGAINIGIKHQNVFRILVSHSGFFDPQTDHKYFRKMLGKRGPLWDLNNPLRQINIYKNDKNICIYVDIGRGDDLLQQNTDFATELSRNRIPHVFEITNGGHHWYVWRKRFRVSLPYVDMCFKKIAKASRKM